MKRWNQLVASGAGAMSVNTKMGNVRLAVGRTMRSRLCGANERDAHTLLLTRVSLLLLALVCYCCWSRATNDSCVGWLRRRWARAHRHSLTRGWHERQKEPSRGPSRLALSVSFGGHLARLYYWLLTTKEGEVTWLRAVYGDYWWRAATGTRTCDALCKRFDATLHLNGGAGDAACAGWEALAQARTAHKAASRAALER